MATNFDENAIVMSGGIKPSTKNTPTDVRTRIESISEVGSIPLPFVGMIFYVKDVEQFYVVKSLKGKKVGPIETPDSLVDEFEPLFTGLASEQFVQEAIDNVELIQGPEGPMGPEGPEGPKGQDGYTPVIGVDYFTEEEIAAIKYDDTELREMIESIEVPSIEGLASEEFVQQQIEAIEFPEGYDDSELREIINNEVRAREAFVEEKIAELVNGAPETLNTLHELAKAVKEHEDICEAYVQVNNEALAVEVAERKAEDKAIRDLIKKEVDLIHEEMVEEVGLINQEMEEEIEKVNDVITEQVEKLNSEHTEHVITLYKKASEIRKMVDEEKPYLADVAAYPTSKFLFACGQPMTVEPNVGHKYSEEHDEDAVAFVYRWDNGFEAIMVEKAEAEKVYLVGGYGHEKVNVKRPIPQTNMLVRNVKIKGLVGGSYFEGMVGHVNIEAENCQFVSILGAGWCGASVDGKATRMNIADDIHVKMTNCKVSSTFFGGSQGNGVADDVFVELNNCEIGWLTAGGSNGMTRNAEIVMNGGSVKVAQSTNRGIVHKAKFIMNDGVVNKLYFGGETEDSTVDGVIEEAFVELNGGEVKQFCFGTNGGVEMAAEDMKGFIKDCQVKAGDISMLEKIQVEKEIEKRMFMVNESGIEIELPEEAKDFDEIHVFVKHKAGEIKVKDDACKWQADMPELIEGRIYELIFTKVANVWLAGCIEYK